MAQIETSVQIAAPGELVFAFFVPQRMPYWYGAEMEACLEVQGGASEFAVAQKCASLGIWGAAKSPTRPWLQRFTRRAYSNGDSKTATA